MKTNFGKTLIGVLFCIMLATALGMLGWNAPEHTKGMEGIAEAVAFFVVSLSMFVLGMYVLFTELRKTLKY